MDGATISALAALGGSAVGGLTALGGLWLSQWAQARAQEKARERTTPHDRVRAVPPRTCSFARAGAESHAPCALLVIADRRSQLFRYVTAAGPLA